jgi:NAD(P)H-hydrate epimerase
VSLSPQRRYGSITAEDSARLDAAAIATGVAITQLMEVAGFQVARCAWRLLGNRAGEVHVVAGRGHNGGDGLVAARHLAAWGCAVTAAVLGTRDDVDDLMHAQVTAALGAGVSVRVSDRPDDVLDRIDGVRLVIDGLLGTGLRQPPRPAHATVINGLRGSILSIDVPSGLDATTGTAPGATVHATTTCTLAAVKSGVWVPGARPYTGDVDVADIGMPRTAWEVCGLVAPSSVRAGRLLRVPLP